MADVLKKIPIRKALREKGKSSYVIAAVFFTTVLFVTVFSTLFFVKDAAEEMMRSASPMLADAAFTVTEEEYGRVCQNKRVSEAGMGIRIGEMMEPSGAGGILLFTFEDRMAQWMRYAPKEGRMPKKGNEIVLSDQFLRERGLTYEAGEQIELTYDIGEEEYTDTFTVVGTYERAMQPLHAALVSDDFYRSVRQRLERRGVDPEDVTYRMAGVTFASRGNVRRLVSRLIVEEGLALEEGEIFLNDVSLFGSMGAGFWAALGALLAFVTAVGYLFISNIFHISISGDARFYGKLATNGVTKREIRMLIRRQNHVLFLIAVVPALLAGYAFSAAILPDMISAYTALQVRRSGNAMIFVLSPVFSYMTVKLSERRPVRLAKNASPIEMKKYTGKFRRVKTADNKDCLRKFIVRHFQGDKARALKVCVSVALSILLANAFYAMAAGFDVEEYVKGDIDADFILAKEAVFTNPNLNVLTYERTTEEEVAAYGKLPGLIEAGGGSTSHICLRPSEEVWDAFVEITGEDSCRASDGMWTEVYGLDDMLLQKLKPIQGEIDLDLFRQGGYVLLDPIMSDDNAENAACYRPGDAVTIPFMSGEEGTYTVMAVVERLPDSLSLPGRYYASELYLPMSEWRAKEKRTDYYLYAFEVEEEYHDVWNDTLERDTGGTAARLAYRSARTAARKAEGYVRGLKLAGFVLSMILLSMGILNFINCTVGSVYSRRKEFAILQSMGMEEQEILRNLAKEGLLYLAGGFVQGVLLAVPGVYFLLEKVLREPCITYRFYSGIYLLFAVSGCAVAVLTPWISYRMMDRRENFLYRIRSCKD